MTQAADVAVIGNDKCYAVDGPGEYGWCEASPSIDDVQTDHDI